MAGSGIVATAIGALVLVAIVAVVVLRIFSGRHRRRRRLYLMVLWEDEGDVTRGEEPDGHAD